MAWKVGKRKFNIYLNCWLFSIGCACRYLLKKEQVVSLKSVTDKYLFCLIADDDYQAFDKIFRQYYRSLCRFASFYIEKEEIVEELVTDAFVKIWEKRQSMSKVSYPKAYLYKTVKNEVLKYLSKPQSVDTLLNEIDDLAPHNPLEADHPLLEADVLQQLHRSLQKLPTQTRMAFELHRFDGLTYADIASLMGISVSTVEKHLVKALSYLKKHLVRF